MHVGTWQQNPNKDVIEATPNKKKNNNNNNNTINNMEQRRRQELAI